MKKIYFLFLLALLPLVASADAVKIGSIYYNLNAEAKTAEVTVNPDEYSGEIVIPKTVTYQSVKYKVTSIGNEAFKLSYITSVTIPGSVTTIGDGAFYNCFLTSVIIPNSVTSIGSQAFCECSSLTSVTIGTSVTSIGEYAFSYCSGLASVYISDLGAWCKIRFDDNPLQYAEHLFLNGTEIKDLVIPTSVTSISDRAFAGFSGLTSVTIGNGVTSIGVGAFSSCSNMASVTIGNGVTSIGNYAFYRCSGLTSVTIPNSVTSIGDGAFQYCDGLTSVTIPNSVTSIGYSTFRDCRSLTFVNIPNSVTSIGYSAFEGSGLTSIIIPNSVTSIEQYAFRNCFKLTDVYCFAENVPSTNSYAFRDSNIGNAILHVPAGSVDAYKAAYPWSEFKDKVAIAVKVKLNKSKATIEKTKTLTLKATVTPTSFPDKSVTWKSSNTKVATVTSAGKVKGVKAGTATITCTSVLTGEKATCKVTVGYVKLDQTEAIIEKGKTMTLIPTVYPSSLTDKSVTWTSSDTKIATVTSTGKVKGIKYGTATITCTSVATGLSTTCAVTVGLVTLNKYKMTLKKGKTETLTPTVYPSSLADKSVTWTSSNTKVATVTSTGKVKGVKTGTATITCTSKATGLSRTCEVLVANLTLNNYELTIQKGKTATLKATVYPSSLEDKSVTWESSNTKVATVSSSGKVKGVKAGTATITCTSTATGLSRTCTVTVTATSGSRSVEGDDDDTTGIENLEEAPALAEPYDVYDLSGRKVRHQVNSLDGLPEGIYIVNGRKVLKKK